MKILLLNDTSASSPGNIVNMLARGYEENGHTVSVLTDLPISYRKSFRHYHCLYAPNVSKMLVKELESIQPDIVHVHNIHQYLTYDALRIAHAYTSRVFMTMHDVFSFAFGRLNTPRYLNSFGQDVSLTVFDHIRSAGFEINPLRNVWIRHLLRRYVRNVVAVSHALKRALEQHGIGDVSVIHNGIGTDEWARDEVKVNEFKNRFDLHGRKVILFGGRISRDKGTKPLLDMLNRLQNDVQNVLLLVVGDEKRWGNRDSQQCRFTGWLDRSAMRSAMHAADVVTAPSLCLDCFPQTNLEAMAAGKPIVGTIFGGTSEAVVDGVTGFVLNPRNIGEYMEKMKLLLTDDSLRQRMGEAGRQRVKEEFSVEKQVQKYLRLFSEKDAKDSSS